jgi:hypothetical protein
LVGGGGCERKSDATWELPFLKSNTIDGFLGSSNGSRSPWFRLSTTQCTCVYIQINMRTLIVYLTLERTIFNVNL